MAKFNKFELKNLFDIKNMKILEAISNSKYKKANKGGVFLSLNANKIMEGYGIILPKGGVILPHYTIEEYNELVKSIEDIKASRWNTLKELANKKFEAGITDHNRLDFCSRNNFFIDLYFNKFVTQMQKELNDAEEFVSSDKHNQLMVLVEKLESLGGYVGNKKLYSFEYGLGYKKHKCIFCYNLDHHLANIKIEVLNIEHADLIKEIEVTLLNKLKRSDNLPFSITESGINWNFDKLSKEYSAVQAPEISFMGSWDVPNLKEEDKVVLPLTFESLLKVKDLAEKL